MELGTHFGEAYFTFCQTVQDNGLSSVCYAVDHWLGDEHAGFYGGEVFEEVRQYNERYYKQFSYLLRMSFDEALAQFSDGSIDLLHIDGLHTYEAASHDFRSWWPKVKPGGVVLLHDIVPKHQDFGVWRLWDEIKAEFPNTFEFHHSWGLGVVRKDNNGSTQRLLECLFNSSAPVREELRRRYVVYGSHLENLLGLAGKAAGWEGSVQFQVEVPVQVFPFGETGYSEKTGLSRMVTAGKWNTLLFELPEGIGKGPLRIDPGYEPGFIEIGEILLNSQSSEELLWSADGSSGREYLSSSGTATWATEGNRSLLVSGGDDPQLMLTVPGDLQGPMKLTISLRISPALNPGPEVVTAWVKSVQANMQASSEQQIAVIQQERDRVADELARTLAENKRIVVESERRRDFLLDAETKLHREQSIRTAMQESLSWRMTKPIRRLMSALRSGPRKTS